MTKIGTAKLCGFSTIRDRNVAIVKYMLRTDATSREAGKYFGLAKSTILRACADIMILGQSNKRYSKMGHDIFNLLQRHIDRSLFKPKKTKKKRPLSNLFKSKK